jgi:hypothetical protein
MGMAVGAQLSGTGRLPRLMGGRAPSRGRAEDRADRSGSGCEVGNEVGAAADMNAGNADEVEGAS